MPNPGGRPPTYTRCQVQKRNQHFWDRKTEDDDLRTCIYCGVLKKDARLPPPPPKPPEPTEEELLEMADELAEQTLRNEPYKIHPRNHNGYPEQKLLVESTAKRKMVRAGRRSGKTSACAIIAVRAFAAGRRVLYCTPTAEQLNAFWKECCRALAELINHGKVYKNETEHIIEFSGTPTRLRGKTAWNPETMRGDTCDLLILDEYQLMNETSWAEAGQPMLIDNNGDAILIFTPPSLASRSLSKANDKRHASKMFKEKQNDPEWLCMHYSSRANPFISKEGLEKAKRDMSKLAYEQEIEALDTDQVAGALLTRELIEKSRCVLANVWDYKNQKWIVDPEIRAKHPDAEIAPEIPDGYRRIVVGIDPSGSSTTEVGIVAAGEGPDGQIYILKDESMFASRPKAWAATAIKLLDKLSGDRIVAEDNFGGSMVAETLRTVDENAPYKSVHASKGKIVRAEPVSALVENRRCHFVGDFPELEEEWVSYTGMPGEKSPNRLDACLSPGVLIETIDGPAPIESIGPGTLVLTRSGYKRVLRAGLTGRNRPIITALFSNGISLAGTGNHPVWTENRGFIPMDALNVRDTLLACHVKCRNSLPHVEKQSYLKVSRTIDILTANSVTSAFISLAARMAQRFSYTVQFGNRSAGRFRQAITYIMSMMTLGIMRYPITGAYHQVSTIPNFAASPLSVGANTWPRYARWHQGGTAVQRESLGTAGMANKWRLNKNQGDSVNARLAAKLSSATSHTKVSATGPVMEDTLLESTGMRYKKDAWCAENRSGRENAGAKRNHVPLHVLEFSDGGRSDVYNLEVEDAHEYFANGILVHNCVWTVLELIGFGALGLVDWMKEGGAQKFMDQQQRKVSAATSLAEVMTNDQTPKCPKCHEITLQNMVSGSIRCGHCGFQRLPNGKQPTDSPLGGRRAIDLRKFR